MYSLYENNAVFFLADDFLNVTVECSLEINEHLERELGGDY